MFRSIGRLGDWTARRLSRLGALARLGLGALWAGVTLAAASRAVARIDLFTGVRPMPGDRAPTPTRADTAAGTGTRP